MPWMFNTDEIRELCYKQKGTNDADGNPRTIVHHIDFNHDNNDPENLIWLSKSEHSSLHAKRNVGWKMTEEQRKTLSESHKNSPLKQKSLDAAHAAYMLKLKNGDPIGMKNKTHTDETKIKMSESRKRYLSKIDKKECGNGTRGKHWKLVNGKRKYYGGDE